MKFVTLTRLHVIENVSGSYLILVSGLNPYKLANATAIGVLCISSLRGNTGAILHVSTETNSATEIPLPRSKPHTKGLDHGISSAVFRLTPRRRHPTAKTSVSDPSQSTRRSLSCVDIEVISGGSWMFNLMATRVIGMIRRGIWQTLWLIRIGWLDGWNSPGGEKTSACK